MWKYLPCEPEDLGAVLESCVKSQTWLPRILVPYPAGSPFAVYSISNNKEITRCDGVCLNPQHSFSEVGGRGLQAS